MADETFLDLGVQADGKEVQAFSNSLEKVIKSLDTLSKKLDKAVRTINKYTNALSEQMKTQGKALGIEEEHTDTTQENTNATDDNTEATEKNTIERKKQNEEMKKSVQGFIGLVGAITGAITVLNRLTTDLAKSNQAMLNLTRNTDIALSAFQKWDGLGKLFGIDNAEQQLASLNEKIFNLKLTGEGARGFQLAGIMPTTAEDVLEQLRNRVKGMSDTSATYLLQQMGLNPQMLTLLRMSRGEFEELGQTIKKYQLTEEQRIQIQKLNGQMQLVNIQFQYFKDRAILAIMPHLVKFMQSLARITEMFANLIEKVKDNTALRSITVGFGYLLLNIRKISAWFLVLSRNATKFQTIFLAIGKTCAGVARFFRQFSGVITTLIAKIPILGKVLLGLGGIFKKVFLPLYAIYLLLDDLAVFFSGGKSLIGEVIDWGKEKGGEIANAFGKMFGGDIVGGASDLLDSILQAIIDVQSTVKTLFEKLLNFLTLGLWEKFTNSKIGNFFTGKDDIEKLKKLSQGESLGELAYLSNPTAANQMINNYNSNAINNTNNSPSITQNIEIATNQPANDIQQSLKYANALVTAQR